ncbi:MAG: inositol-3-phosphate synthase [Phycisphaerae bacterium]|jgi:myo-inositol-1-phosphate synthase|nr:MAG: inositol-3-phosphate synthase [Phycisphaerae bacterium]
MSKIRIAIAGVGNCASSLVQGIYYYSNVQPQDSAIGLMHPRIGPYQVSDIECVAAFDIDSRKVGRPLNDALVAPPNNTKIFHPLPAGIGPVVQMSPILDGISDHMDHYPEEVRFIPANAPPIDVAEHLSQTRTDILVNYMPVGAQKATEYFAQACLDAKVAFVNCVPCFIVSDQIWAERFREKGLPCVGDDIKAQLGATITHRVLARLFASRGVRINNTYQLNMGGNTDFLNMLNRSRLTSKKKSKTEAVQSQLDLPLDDQNIHIGPSDFVPFLKDNKICFLRIEGTGFGGVPLHLELRLSVEDSPNSAGVVVDAVRCCKLALDAKLGGPLDAVCAWTMKHPPHQMNDSEAMTVVEQFIARTEQLIARQSLKAC